MKKYFRRILTIILSFLQNYKFVELGKLIVRLIRKEDNIMTTNQRNRQVRLEKSLTAYTAMPTSIAKDQLKRKLEKQYGVKIDVDTGSVTTVTRKVKSEVSSHDSESIEISRD